MLLLSCRRNFHGNPRISKDRCYDAEVDYENDRTSEKEEKGVDETDGGKKKKKRMEEVNTDNPRTIGRHRKMRFIPRHLAPQLLQDVNSTTFKNVASPAITIYLPAVFQDTFSSFPTGKRNTLPRATDQPAPQSTGSDGVVS